jgi:hypothetical protein
MPSSFGFKKTLIVIAGLACGAAGFSGGPAASLFLAQAQAAAVEHPVAIDATTSNYAVIAPVFIGTSQTNSPQSFIRFFSGGGTAGTTSNFVVSVVGVPSGQVYGGTTTIRIPPLAMVQYSIQEILSLVSAGALTGGDTGYAVYLQNSNASAGYQHDAYNWADGLFENMSSCTAWMNEQMLSLYNTLVVTGVQTSKQTYPSTVVIHNYSNQSANYNLAV